MARYDPLFQDLPPCIMRVGYWLLLLTKPGQSMIFIPSEMGIKAETLQNYIYEVADVLGRRYRMTGGVRKDENGARAPRDQSLPLTVTRLRS